MINSEQSQLIRSGQLVIRNTDGGQIVAGVLHLSFGKGLIEQGAYLLDLNDGKATLSLNSTEKSVPEEIQRLCLNADALLTHNSGLPGVVTDNALVVRIYRAFDNDPNAVVVLGGTDKDLLPTYESIASMSHNPDGDRDHRWISIRAGNIYGMNAPCPSIGRQVSQILGESAIWPDVNGKPYCLPTMASHWLPVWERYYDICAQRGAEEITFGEMLEAIATDAEIQRIMPDKKLPETAQTYCRFLNEMKKAGFPLGFRALSESEFKLRSQASVKIFSEQLGVGLLSPRR
jgi:hypothetical protein